MAEYEGRFYVKDPKDGLSIFANKETKEEAAVEIMKAFKANKFLRQKYMNGEILEENYPLLKNGMWLIDPETGEKLSDLEKKVDKKNKIILKR